MRRLTELILVGCFLFASIFFQTGCASGPGQLKPADLILPLDHEDKIQAVDKQIKAYFQENQAQFEKLATYLTTVETKFGTRPVPLSLTTTQYIDKISDDSIRQLVTAMLDEAEVQMIIAGLDGDADIRFVFAADDAAGDYQQSLNYVGPLSTGTFDANTADQSEYNLIRRYEKLQDNWFICLFDLAEIKNAQDYRQAAWDYLGEAGQKEITSDWRQARVTLADWDQVGQKIDDSSRDFVVRVQFRTDQDGLLGPITLYLDPVTRKIVGNELRF